MKLLICSLWLIYLDWICSLWLDMNLSFFLEVLIIALVYSVLEYFFGQICHCLFKPLTLVYIITPVRQCFGRFLLPLRLRFLWVVVLKNLDTNDFAPGWIMFSQFYPTTFCWLGDLVLVNLIFLVFVGFSCKPWGFYYLVFMCCSEEERW